MMKAAPTLSIAVASFLPTCVSVEGRSWGDAVSFRKYLLQCERKKVKPSVSRKTDDVWCEVLAFKNQYAPPDFEGIRKDVSKAKVFDMQTSRSIWVRFSILEKDWKWRMGDE